MKKYNVAILGATGAVGAEFLKLIEERNFPFSELRLLASKRSAGKEIAFMGKTYTVEEATFDSFKGMDIALFAGGSISKDFAPHAVKAGPNCSTIIMVMALKPIYDLAKIKRVIVSTYQAVSGAGKEGIDELDAQVREHSEGREMTANILPSASAEKHYPIAFNLIPQIDVFCDNLYTKEEMKMVNETKKIMEDYEMRITATTIRVPVYRSHSESVNIELEKEVDLGAMREALAKFPGVTVQDDPSKQEYPMPLYTSEKDDVYVGRLRRDESCEKSYNMWVVGDQIRKGAALNTLQIAETMIKNGWI